MPQFPEIQQRFATPRAVALPGAIADTRLGTALETVGNVLGDLAERRQQAKNVSEFNLLNSEATKQLNDLKQSFELRTDFENFEPEFQNKADELKTSLLESAASPAVRKQIEQQFNQKQLTTSLKISELATARQKDISSANLAQTDSNAIQNIDATDNPLERKQLIAQHLFAIRSTVRTGQISAARGKKMELDFINKIDFSAAQKSIRSDPEGFDDRDFKNLTPQQRIQLTDAAIRFAEKGQRELDKQTKERQDANHFEFVNRLLDPAQTVTQEQVVRAVRSNRLSALDGESLIKMIRNPPPLQSDIRVVSVLNSRLLDGELTIGDVTAAASRNSISATQQQRFVELLTSRISSNPAFKRAKNKIDAEFEETFFGVKALEDERQFNEMMEALIERSEAGKENPLDVADDIIVKFRKDQQAANVKSTERAIGRKLGRNPNRNRVDKELQRLRKEIDGNNGIISERQQTQIKILMELRDTVE